MPRVAFVFDPLRRFFHVQHVKPTMGFVPHCSGGIPFSLADMMPESDPVSLDCHAVRSLSFHLPLTSTLVSLCRHFLFFGSLSSPSHFSYILLMEGNGQASGQERGQERRQAPGPRRLAWDRRVPVEQRQPRHEP